MCIRNANGFDRHCCSRILFGANNWMWIHANEMDETIENCRFNLMRLELLFRIASHYLSIYLHSGVSPFAPLSLSISVCIDASASMCLYIYDCTIFSRQIATTLRCQMKRALSNITFQIFTGIHFAAWNAHTRWREKSGNATEMEFILFTFSRNPVMIASYKIDEICHKNEDVYFI